MAINQDGILLTPFAYFPMKKNKIYEDDVDETIKYGFVAVNKGSFLEVEHGHRVYSGFFHTFEQETDAKRNCDDLNRKRLNKDVVYQVYPCVIPDGSEYIKGRYLHKEFVFASKKLMILDE